jgi:hypothetical protein
MRVLASFARRRFTVGGLVLGGWGLVRGLVGAPPADAGGTQMQPQMQKKQGTQQPSTLGGSAPFRAKAKSFEVSGGSKPGDTVTLKLKIETTGGGTKSVPWTIYRDNDVVLKSDTKTGVAGGTTFEVSTTWVAAAGSHDFYGEVDPQNTLGEPSGQRANNLSQTTTRVFSDWPRWLTAAKAGTKTGVGQWRDQAKFTGIKINGPVASGGRVEGPDIGGPIVDALKNAGMPNDAAQHFGHAVDGAWRDWAHSIHVPDLHWYPAFAALALSIAPPTPNVPTPISRLAHDAGKLNGLAGTIKGSLGAAKDWPGATAAIDEFAGWLKGSAEAWFQGGCMIANVMGKGPVPAFAPPYVPVGPVVGGDNVATPGVFSSCSIPWQS